MHSGPARPDSRRRLLPDQRNDASSCASSMTTRISCCGRWAAGRDDRFQHNETRGSGLGPRACHEARSCVCLDPRSHRSIRIPVLLPFFSALAWAGGARVSVSTARTNETSTPLSCRWGIAQRQAGSPATFRIRCEAVGPSCRVLTICIVWRARRAAKKLESGHAGVRVCVVSRETLALGERPNAAARFGSLPNASCLSRSFM